MTEHPNRPRPALPALLIILGAPNDAHGELLPIAEARARAAICEYHRRPDCKIVVTGGHGRHFNTSGIPHAHHVARFLVAHEVPREDLILVDDTGNTVEDAAHAMSVVARFDVRVLCVITSDFHRERAGMIFRAFYPRCALEIIADPAPLSPEERERLVEHEVQAIQRLRAQGGIVVGTGGTATLWPLRDPDA
jgi:uncharacterized SAM-binding protein YcdF (DUF218 family)